MPGAAMALGSHVGREQCGMETMRATAGGWTHPGIWTTTPYRGGLFQGAVKSLGPQIDTYTNVL